MKILKHKSRVILVTIIVGMLCFSAGIFLAKEHYSVPQNCSAIAVAYLEMGKKYYGLDSSNQQQWQEAIDRETFIQNHCLEQFPKQYPWDFTN
jgi:hypothetical protein